MNYEGQISYITIDNKGNDKTVKESYIFENAELFGEVESRLYDEYGDLTDFEVLAIKKSKIKEIVNHRECDEDKVFIAEVASTFLDEETCEEKVTVSKMALYAEHYDAAYRKINEYMKQGYTDLELVSLKKTSFIDIL